jgi:replicative DNA helicase
MTERRKNSNIDISSMIYGKIPPSAVDLEKDVLGYLLVDYKLIIDVKAILSASDFYKNDHQLIYQAICDVSEYGAVDLRLVAQNLKDNGKLDEVGGVYAIVSLTNNVTQTLNLKKYCLIIKQKSIARKLIMLGGEIISKSHEDTEDVFSILESAEQSFKNINNELSEIKVTPLESVAMNIIERFDTKVYNAKNGIIDENEIKTHFEEWDRINGSLFAGLYVVAGRPAMGKGVHLTELACRMGKHYDIGIINGEMTNEQLLTRIGCNLLNIDNFLFKKNPLYITEEEQELVKLAMNEALNLKIHIDNNRQIEKIANKIRLWVHKYKVKCVLADFLTLFKVRDELAKYFTDKQRVDYVLNVFVDLCKELKIPIILYVQMNREILGRHGIKEPNMADLKASGSIEELAYQVSFLHRPEYYDKDNITDENGNDIKGLCYQIIAKHRDGENARLMLRAKLQCSQMKEWSITPHISLDEPLPF